MKSKIQQKIEEALGHTSAIFMSQECKGTEIVMPTEQLIKISEQLAQEIVDMVVEEIEKHCPDRYLPSNKMPSGDDFITNRALRNIINLLKK